MNLDRSLQMVDSSYEPYLEQAREDACQVTLWEKITRSNHEDVRYYKGLLKQYTEELLDIMVKDSSEISLTLNAWRYGTDQARCLYQLLKKR